MANNEHRTNLKLNADNWVRLQSLAAIQNTSPTKIINQLIDSYVNENLPADYEARIESKVYSMLDSKVEDTLIETLARRIQVKLSSDIWLDAPSQTIDTDSTDSTDVETNTDKTVYIVDTDSTDSTDSTTNTDSTVNEKEVRRIERNLNKFRRYKASDRKTGVTDVYIAAKENLSQSAVQRYRKGLRSPKADFIERWGLNWNGSQWVKN